MSISKITFARIILAFMKKCDEISGTTRCHCILVLHFLLRIFEDALIVSTPLKAVGFPRAERTSNESDTHAQNNYRYPTLVP